MTRDEKQHKGKLAELGCMACLRIHGPHTPGPVELHHRGSSGVHGLGTKGFDKAHPFTQRDLLADALRLSGVL